MKLLAITLLSIAALTSVSADEEPASRVAEEVLPLPDSIGLAILPNSQLMVAAFECHGPASRAGITSGDRIIEVDGKPVLTLEDFRRALHAAAEKRTIKVVIERNQRREAVTIKLARD